MAAISNSFSSGLDSRKQVAKLDYGLIFATLALVVLGLMSIYSEGYGKDGLSNFKRQLVNTVIGLIPMAAMYFVPIRFLQRAASGLYIAVVGLLAGSLVLGKTINGSQRWIDIGPLQFQPSDPAKLLSVITLAAFFTNRLDRIKEPSTFFWGLAHVALPIALILKQPHLAAALLMLFTGFAISLVAGTPIKFFAMAVGVFTVVAASVLLVPPVRDLLLRDYQKDRIEGLMSTTKDNKDANYQTDRAEIAFGVGGLYGTGFLNGKQKELKFIPEQRNDFVFTVLGEETGLLGCTIVLIAYAFFFYRVFMIMLKASEPFYQMMAAGIFAVLGFHTVVNLGMVLQLLPVAGMWLPFMSSGGTAIWLCLACVGLLLNIKRHERPVLF